MNFDEPSVGFKKLQRRDPRWLTSFADLMALLFAMFVLLLSFSEIDSTSFKQNAGPISEAFDAKKPKVTTPSEDKPMEQAPSDRPMVIDLRNPVTQIQPNPTPDVPPPEDYWAVDTAEQLKFVLAQEIRTDMIDVLRRDDMVVIRFNDRAAFATGERELNPAILPALTRVASIITKTPGRVRVEGHTDDVPINTEMFRSNWDLSVARAASVVHMLIEHGVSPGDISAEGLADSRPLAPNDTAEGRALNRRVEVVLEVKRDATVTPATDRPD